MDITSWVDWCAVLGFALSLCIAVLELARGRKHLTVDQAKVVFAEKEIFHCNFFFTVTNRSSTAISINAIYLLTDNNRKLTADVSGAPIFSQSIKSKGPDGEYSNLLAYSDRTSTQFPVFLQPYESRAILLRYDLPQKTRKFLRLPSAHNRQEPAHNARWACRILLATSRGAVQLDLLARIAPLRSIFEMLDRECEANAIKSGSRSHLDS